MKRESVFILKNGAQWLSDGQSAWTEEDSLALDDVYVDGRLVGEIGEIVLRDRHRLSQDGFVVVYVPINKQHKLAGEPRLFSRGFLRMDTAGELLDAAREELKRELRRNGRNHDDTVRETLQNFFYHKTQSRPVILPNIVRV
jgi:ribonuclease J